MFKTACFTFIFHTLKIVFTSQFLLARECTLLLVPLFPLFSSSLSLLPLPPPLSFLLLLPPSPSSPLPPPSGKISHHISLPPVLQCISQIHLELDYLLECTRRDPETEGRERGWGRKREGKERGRRGKREGRKEGEEERGRGKKYVASFFGTCTVESGRTKGPPFLCMLRSQTVSSHSTIWDIVDELL